MFNINIKHEGYEKEGDFIVHVTTTDGTYVTSQTCSYDTADTRRTAFDKALSYARGFEDGVRSVRNHIDARISSDDLIKLAKAGIA